MSVYYYQYPEPYFTDNKLQEKLAPVFVCSSVKDIELASYRSSFLDKCTLLSVLVAEG